MKSRQQAWATVAALTPEQIEAIALIIETTDSEGDYNYNDEDGSYWEDDAAETLISLAREFRSLADGD